jgi:hypothetical protein
MVLSNMFDMLRPYGGLNGMFHTLRGLSRKVEIFSLDCGLIRIIARPLQKASPLPFIWGRCGQVRHIESSF